MHFFLIVPCNFHHWLFLHIKSSTTWDLACKMGIEHYKNDMSDLYFSFYLVKWYLINCFPISWYRKKGWNILQITLCAKVNHQLLTLISLSCTSRRIKSLWRMASHVVGYPRIGPKRELKFALEAFWDGKSSAQDLLGAWWKWHHILWIKSQ